MQHLDSHGHKGELSPGDVQWMTAGAGIVHSEMPADDVYEQGGTSKLATWPHSSSDSRCCRARFDSKAREGETVDVAPGRPGRLHMKAGAMLRGAVPATS